MIPWRKRPKNLYYYLGLIANEWPDFRDDGLSFFPDWVYRRWNLSRAGRVHDWHYCTRCHPMGSMTRKAKRFGDRGLRQHAREVLPRCVWLAPNILYHGVRVGGRRAWNSCGFDVGERCRHNIKRQPWQYSLAGFV